MKKFVIDETLILNIRKIDNTLTINFDDNAKQCKDCLAVKNKKCFYKNNKFKDGLNIYCSICIKDHNRMNKIKKLRKETNQIISKIRVSVEAETMGKIKQVVNLTEDTKILQKLKTEVEKIYFKQSVNDEMLNNIIGNQ